MSVKIESGDLAATINMYLDEYGDAIAEEITASSKAVAKDVVGELKKGGGFGGTGEFNKGWTSSTETSRIGTTTTVYNKSQPGLAHLLEFGHAKRNGGRTRAFNFIAPVVDSIEGRFMGELNSRIGG